MKPLSELEEVIDLCLDQDDESVQASRDAVANAPANSVAHVDKLPCCLYGKHSMPLALQR